MRNYFNSMKKIKFSLFFLLSVFGLCAQSPILVLEAENADSIHSPARVKSGDGFSNGKYVGGNDRGSYLFFHNVTMEKAGTYEFKTYFNCNGVRRFTVKVNNYPEVECTVNGTAKWDTPPAETAKALIYLAAGTNTIKITPYPTTSGGPNLDKFEILETSESPLPVPQEGFPITLEAEYAHLYGDLKVKNLKGMSNGRYVGDFNNKNNSYLQFTCVDIPEEGPYELKIFTNDPTGRPLDIQINNYAKTYINVNKSEGKWDQLPTAETSVLVWLDKGLNTISFTESCRYNGPNIDKVEIHETDQTMEKPDIEKPYPESCKEIDEYKISFMGSSVCYGTGATKDYGYAYMYTDLLKQRKQENIGKDWTTSNISIGGNTTQMVLDRWERDLLRDCGRYVFYGLSLGNERNNGTQTDQAAKNYEKGMKQLIRQADSVGIVPVMASNYANAGFNSSDYEILKNLNLTIQQWEAPSVNMLGAVDNGAGRWVKAIESDGAHPNSDGHREMSYAIVPSLFDALDAGKTIPQRQLFFWRSGMNDKEIAAVAEGKMLRSSLEIYAPLSNESPLLNLAQSTNTLALVENTTSGITSLKERCMLFSPNPVRQGERVNAGCSGIFEIYSVNGMLLDRQTLRNENETISTDALTAGTYVIHSNDTGKIGLLVIY